MSCNKTPVFSVLYAKSIESSFGNTRTPFLPYGKRRRALPSGGRLPSACLSLPTFLPKNRVLQKKNRKDAHKKHFTRKTVPYTVSPFFRLQSRCPLRLFGFIFRLRCHQPFGRATKAPHTKISGFNCVRNRDLTYAFLKIEHIENLSELYTDLFKASDLLKAVLLVKSDAACVFARHKRDYIRYAHFGSELLRFFE